MKLHEHARENKSLNVFVMKTMPIKQYEIDQDKAGPVERPQALQNGLSFCLDLQREKENSESNCIKRKVDIDLSS